MEGSGPKALDILNVSVLPPCATGTPPSGAAGTLLGEVEAQSGGRTAFGRYAHLTFQDHAKWAVSDSSTSDWACGLDNNHCASQLVRSGLAACVEGTSLGKLLRNADAKHNNCGDPPPTPP